MKRLILWSIRFYQRFLSPDTGFPRVLFRASVCRFEPTCSEYTYQAVNRYGIIYGLWLGTRRILKCHPWHPGGLDPIP